MRQAARLQAAIELLDQIIAAAREGGAPADRIIAAYFKTRRYAGSKDRRAVRELVYAAIRACGPVPANGRAAMLRLAEDEGELAALFDGSEHGPPAIGDNERPAQGGLAPAWLCDALKASEIEGDEAQSLLSRAPLDIRINSLKADPAALILPEPGEALPAAPLARRYPHGTAVQQWPAYREGEIEVQDLASQLAVAAMDVKPGETVIDLCAGAGGKTLALAAMMDNQGTLIACDTNRARLSRLGPRAERAGAKIAAEILLNPGHEREALSDWAGKADRVLVDAPCSGTGTWRRNPEARWRLTPAELARYQALQLRLLEIGAALLSPGGLLCYGVCSLLDAEGADIIAQFLERRPQMRAVQPLLSVGRARGEGIRFTPYHDGTDGFFVATLTAPC